MSSFEARANARRKARITEYATNLRQSETLTERAVWSAIRCSALGVTFRRQVPIGGCLIGDFVANELRLVVEVDGTPHRQQGRRTRAGMRSLIELCSVDDSSVGRGWASTASNLQKDDRR